MKSRADAQTRSRMTNVHERIRKSRVHENDHKSYAHRVHVCDPHVHENDRKSHARCAPPRGNERTQRPPVPCVRHVHVCAHPLYENERTRKSRKLHVHDILPFIYPPLYVPALRCTKFLHDYHQWNNKPVFPHALSAKS